MSRSINGLLGDNRSLNGISSDTSTLILSKLKADLPLEYDEETFTYNIKGLNTLGSANQIIKVNSGGTAQEYADDSNTEYTGTAPINISPSNVISLKGLNGFSANKIIKCNPAGDGLIYADDSDTNYWNLDGSTLTPKLDSYNTIIGDADSGNPNNVELKVAGDAEIKNTLFSTNNNKKKIDFNTTYGLDVYGLYYTKFKVL